MVNVNVYLLVKQENGIISVDLFYDYKEAMFELEVSADMKRKNFYWIDNGVVFENGDFYFVKKVEVLREFKQSTQIVNKIKKNHKG